jgi:protein-tyrosine phosphatase
MELASNLLGPTRRSYWVVENRFAAGAYPGKKVPGEDPDNPVAIQMLLNAGINVIINLTQDYSGGTDAHLSHYDLGATNRAVIERFPIVDESIPTVDTMRQIIDSMNAHLNAGDNIYVHCWGGSGRTGTVVGCWLIENGFVASRDVIEEMQKLRVGDLDGGHKPTPQNIDQAEFIWNWERVLNTE